MDAHTSDSPNHLLGPLLNEGKTKKIYLAKGSTDRVTVVAKDGVMADGLDTGIFIMGPERGMALIERLADVEGIIVDDEGRILISSGLKDRVLLSDPTYK